MSPTRPTKEQVERESSPHGRSISLCCCHRRSSSSLGEAELRVVLSHHYVPGFRQNFPQSVWFPVKVKLFSLLCSVFLVNHLSFFMKLYPMLSCSSTERKVTGFELWTLVDTVEVVWWNLLLSKMRTVSIAFMTQNLKIKLFFFLCNSGRFHWKMTVCYWTEIFLSVHACIVTTDF
jgi:hypothetical protein